MHTVFTWDVILLYLSVQICKSWEQNWFHFIAAFKPFARDKTAVSLSSAPLAQKNHPHAWLDPHTWSEPVINDSFWWVNMAEPNAGSVCTLWDCSRRTKLLSGHKIDWIDCSTELRRDRVTTQSPPNVLKLTTAFMCLTPEINSLQIHTAYMKDVL